MLEQRWRVQVGEASTSALYEPAVAAPTQGLLVLGHGAGSRMDHPNLGRHADLLRGCGLDVVRFNFLYREAGKGLPDRMPRLQECFSAVAEEARTRFAPSRLFIGGHSMGGRAASMMAADGFPCDGLVLLAYPLHPPGQPEKLRTAHLGRISQPVLCVNGTEDPFCGRELMEQALRAGPPNWTMHWLEHADHSFHVLKRSGRTDADARDELAEAVSRWLKGPGGAT